MRSTIIVRKLASGQLVMDVIGRYGGGGRGSALRGEPHEIAAIVASAAVDYCQSNPEGGDVMAPPEIMELIPEHLRSVPNEAAERGAKGGAAKTEAKAEASRENGKKGGRPHEVVLK